MSKLIESNEGYLRSLPIIDVFLIFEVGKLHLPPGSIALGNHPLKPCLGRDRSYKRIDAFRCIPKGSFLSYLGGCPSENDPSEVGIIEMPNGLKEKGKSLSASGSAAKNSNIRLGRGEFLLRSFLRLKVNYFH